MMQNKLDATTNHHQALREAVFAGLSAILSEQDTMTAIRSWDIYAESNNSIFNGVNTFARELCMDIQQPEKQREVAKALNRALISSNNKAKQPSDMPPPKKPTAPASLSAAKKPLTEPEVKSAVIFSPEFETFKAVLVEILLRIELQSAQYRESAQVYLEELIHSMPWSPIQQQQLHDALMLKDVYQTRNYQAGQLKSFLSHFISWINDEFGQKLGSEIVQDAWDIAAVSDQGLNYHPKQLL